MRRTPIHLMLIAGATLTVVTGCSQRHERRARETYRDIVRGDDAADRVDLNTASKRQLSRLPGLTDDDAERIVANRPYPNKRALLNRGIIGERKFEQIQDYVYVSEDRR